MQREQNAELDGVVRYGTDPPDFVVHAHEEIRVELAQFTNRARRNALGLLGTVRKAIINDSADRFQHLRGRLVMVGFEDPAGLPPRRGDREAIDLMLSKLEQLDPGPEPPPIDVATERDGYVVTIHNVPLGAGSLAAFPLPSMPGTEISRTHGLELAACLTVTVHSRDIETELKRIVADHDQRENDILLISAGAPSRSGLCLIGDEIAVEEHILGKIALPQPDHLKRILLHRWSFGDVYEIYPSQRKIVNARVEETGGPYIVPVTRIPAVVWNSECPCGSQSAFGACHGAR